MEYIKKLFEENNIDFTEENLAIYLYFINRKDKDTNSLHDYHPITAIQNKFDEESEGLIQTQQASLQNSIMGVESRAVSYVIENLFKVQNKFNEVGEIIPEEEQNNLRKELTAILIGYYGIIVPLFGRNTLDKRAKEFGLFTNFKMNNDIKDYIKDIAEKASSSHIQTIANDLLDTINETYNKLVEDQLEVIRSVRKVTDPDLVLARKKALEGASQQQIAKAIRQEYNDKILKVRAKAIARTETNRAFTQSQFQADLQFIKQNGYENKAYKKWITRSDNPCAICLDLAAQPPIPFETNFANIGDTLTGVFTNAKGITRVLKQVVSFEDLTAGNAHVNCACRYQLIIENDFSDNAFNGRGYNPNRDPDGKFGVGSSSNVTGELNDIHVSTAKSYAEGWNYGVNKQIRASNAKDAKVYLKNADDSTLEHIMLLDDATRAQSLSKDSILYRGVVDSESWNSSKNFDGIKVGSEITDYGYASTTFDKNVAKSFAQVGKEPDADAYDSRPYADNPDLTRYVFKINAPVGTKGLAVSRALDRTGEQEFLLQRGSKIKVSKITEKEGHTEVEANLIGVDNV